MPTISDPSVTPESTRTPGPAGSRYAPIVPGRGQEPLGGVLGVDPALDRVPGEAHVLLAERERLAGGDQHLLAHEVEAGDELGHRVLDLDAGVHLEEEVVPVAVEEALDRPGPAVADRPRRVHRDGADPLAQLRRDRRGRRLLDELLMAPLNRAVPLAEVDDGAVGVREHLHLDVPRVFEEPLDVDRVVREVGLALAARGGERALGLVGRADDLEALASPAGRGLDRHGPAVLVPERDHLAGRLDRIGRPGDHRDAGLLHQPPRGHLRAHRLDRLRRRADPDETGLLDGAREGGVLGQEPVAGMDRLRAGALRARRGRAPDGDSSRPAGRARAGMPRRRRRRAASLGPAPSRRRRPRSRARAASGRRGRRSPRDWRPGSWRTEARGRIFTTRGPTPRGPGAGVCSRRDLRRPADGRPRGRRPGGGRPLRLGFPEP